MPLTGGQYERKGRSKATAAVSGVTSQRLRHVELLLHHPWLIDFESDQLPAKIRIANPVSFIAQKILIHEKRDPKDHPKDILYIHDTLQVFGARLHELRELWEEIVAPQLNTRSAKTVVSASGSLFGVLSDHTRQSARIADERGLSPEAIRRACQYGLGQVFK